ncbi:UDPglucose--hexose-1-phosphate uridylyltransferase [Crossiella equi]|uniref:Galactose-1-phosphate uridylyltransferase n=1 Tax=Crossiella equi TaxID=130796 RepID=A0ABS5AE92_9PSEU|nr:galactose-1-phosphate uridylyltransferase [Crossiella equi]MBP2474899.1 UDPglucose--hexose-1-phosphate uridylyltransferase [Crossiella equi]
MRRTSGKLADGREIIYFDDTENAPARTAVDTRDLPEQKPSSEIRRDPLTGEWVALASHRQTRTYKPPADLCPLCPSTPGRPTEIPEGSYDVAVFENRFPSLSQHVPDVPAAVEGVPMAARRPGLGRCEVVCFTSDHNSAFAALTPGRVRTVVDAWADRSAELGALPGVEQVFCFENRGEEIGVTLHHPHGQIYAYPFITPRTERMLATARQYREEHGTHVLGDLVAAELAEGTRVVATSEHWVALVNAAARWPVEVLLVPRRQVADLPELTPAERDDFAVLYLDVLGRLDRLYDRPLPYIASWQQGPVRAPKELSWLHLQVFSILRTADKLKYLAGSESGQAVWINDVTPEQIAQRLREA